MSLVLSPTEFRLLEGLRLNPRRTFTGRIRGERLTRKKGISIEFADYRDYTEGDDLRHLDWNVLARLDNAVIKTYQDEEDLAVYLLVDASASMSFGEPSKLDIARRLACAIGYVAVNGQDAAYPYALSHARNAMAALRGRSSFARLARWSEGIAEPIAGQVSLSGAVRQFTQLNSRPGMVVLLSDALDPELPTQLRVLGGRGHEVNLIQILAPEELDPDLEGDLRLLDAESNAVVEITANSYALKAYRDNLAAHSAALEAACRRFGGRFVQVTTTQPVETVIRERLRREGWFLT